MATIIEQKVIDVMWKDAVTKYRLPKSMTVDNRRQFIGKNIKKMPYGARNHNP